MKHVIIIDEELNGREYGALRSFEKAIIVHTSAKKIILPRKNKLNSFARHSTRWQFIRRLISKKKLDLDLDTDVLWYVLMGPENYRLDLFSGYEHVKNKVVYLFDTLPHQYKLIKKLFSNVIFNFKITSFNDAVTDLEAITFQKWYSCYQAASQEVFQPKTLTEKSIAFSSYGRRDHFLHEIIKEFCAENQLYYDYSIEFGGTPSEKAENLYSQYAWHLTNSVFTVSLPVEFTNKNRASYLSPITCRWFEASVARTVIIGIAPSNAEFKKLFDGKMLIELDLKSSKEEIKQRIKYLWEQQKHIYSELNSLPDDYFKNHTWEKRVQQIINILQL